MNSDDSDSDWEIINQIVHGVLMNSDDSSSSESSLSEVRSLSDSEATLDFFNFPRDFYDRLEDYGRDLWFLKLAMAILMALILGIFSGVLWIIFTLNGYGTH